jgi:hypothetical protein
MGKLADLVALRLGCRRRRFVCSRPRERRAAAGLVLRTLYEEEEERGALVIRHAVTGRRLPG